MLSVDMVSVWWVVMCFMKHINLLMNTFLSAV